jgi:cell division transport system permease protein
LIDFDAPAGINLDSIQRSANAIAPGSRIVAHKDSVAPLLRSLNLLEAVTLGIVFLLSAAAAAAVVLAARGALDTHRFTIEVMHGIGATDLQVTHLFQRKIAIDAFIGSIAGGLAAAAVLLLLAGGAAFAGELTGGATLGLFDVIILVLLPLLLTILATLVGRIAVLRALQDAL